MGSGASARTEIRQGLKEIYARCSAEQPASPGTTGHDLQMSSNKAQTLAPPAEADLLQTRRRCSLMTVPALAKGPEGGKCEATMSFVVDCGSGHSKLYLYQKEDEDIREKSCRLSHVLCDVLAEGDGPLWESFLSECESAGEIEKYPTAAFLLGATGGMRRALETGTVTQENWESFGAAMQKRWPNRHVQQIILTGTEEAMRELVAVRTLKRPMVERMARGSVTFEGCAATAPVDLNTEQVGLMSGGGESCQIAWGNGSDLRMECVRLSTVEAMKRINEDKAAGWQWWQEHLKELAGQKNAWPEGGLTGTFVGTSLQANVAKACGCVGRYVKQPELLERVTELVVDLRATEESEKVRKLREEWEASSKEPWTKRKLINVLAATRLQEMVQDLFSKEASFYFTRYFEIVKGHWMDAQWPLGSFLAM